MATVMMMQWPGTTWEHYEALRREAVSSVGLMPAVQKLKIPGEPRVQFFPALNTFAPNP
jgi:hypothetical protein